MKTKTLKLLFILACLFLSATAFATDKTLKIGIGNDYFASDRFYNNRGETYVNDYTSFEFRTPLDLIYQYNRYLNLKLTIPYVYRKTEYVYSVYNKLGKGIGDIDLSDEILLKEYPEKGLLFKGIFVFTIPTGTSDLRGDLGNNELPTGGPLLGSQGVFKYGGTYNFNFLVSGEKLVSKHKYSAIMGYKVTMPVSSNGERLDPGDIFLLGLGYHYAANEGTDIGVDYESYSSGRTRVGGRKINYTPGIIGTMNPGVSIKIPRAELRLVLRVPIYGKNEYKGVGYNFHILIPLAPCK